MLVQQLGKHTGFFYNYNATKHLTYSENEFHFRQGKHFTNFTEFFLQRIIEGIITNPVVTQVYIDLFYIQPFKIVRKSARI